jgi:flagella basal body P-ring formation protein FlgA
MKFKILLITAALLSQTVLIAKGAVVVLKSGDVNVATSKIYLGDIADIKSVSDENPEDLKTVYIKRAAVPGYKVVVEKEYVINKITKAFPGTVVEGAQYVNVFTSKASVARIDIEKAAKDFILANMPWTLETAEVKVRQVKGSVSVIDGHVLLKVRDDGNFSFKGNMIVPVQIEVDGKYYKTETVAMVVNVKAPCAVASADINRRSVIGADNITMQTRDITFLPANIITDMAVLNNKAPLRNILNGTILTADMFESLPAFRRGSTVDVIVKVHSIRVQSEGAAQSDGKEGDRVKVKLTSGKIVEGTVDSSGKVIIEK